MLASVDRELALTRAQRYSGQEGPICVLRAILAGGLDDVDVVEKRSQPGVQLTVEHNIQRRLRVYLPSAHEADLTPDIELPSSLTIEQTFGTSIAVLDQHIVKLASTWAIQPWESTIPYTKVRQPPPVTGFPSSKISKISSTYQCGLLRSMLRLRPGLNWHCIHHRTELSFGLFWPDTWRWGQPSPPVS